MNITIISAYWAGNEPEIPPALLKVFDYCSNNHTPFICCLDSNAHSYLWGSKNLDKHGEKLEEPLLGNLGVNILNRGSEPTCVASIGRSVIDLTFCSSDLTPWLNDWKVLPECSFSDHKYISTKFSAPTPELIKVRPLATADW